MHLMVPRQCPKGVLSVKGFLVQREGSYFYPSSSWDTVLSQGEEGHSGSCEPEPMASFNHLRGTPPE